MSQPLLPDDIMFVQRLLKSGGLYGGLLTGVWDAETDQAVKAFQTRSAQLAQRLGVFDPRSESNIQTLQLPAQAAARQLLRAILGAGITARVISGTRTYAEQHKLFRQGRFGNPGPIVTKARGGQSNHNFGIAWDIGIFADGHYLTDSSLYQDAAGLALTALNGQIEWGGAWTDFPDRPHYQLVTGLGIAEVRRRFERGETYLPPTMAAGMRDIRDTRLALRRRRARTSARCARPSRKLSSVTTLSNAKTPVDSAGAHRGSIA